MGIKLKAYIPDSFVRSNPGMFDGNPVKLLSTPGPWPATKYIEVFMDLSEYELAGVEPATRSDGDIKNDPVPAMSWLTFYKRGVPRPPARARVNDGLDRNIQPDL